MEGIRWRIGNGRRARGDQDLWISRPNGFCPINATDGRGMRVCDLIDTEDAALVHAIPLSSSDVEDRWIWHYSSQGMCTDSSGYETALMLIRQGRNSGGGGGQLSKGEADKKVWNKVWALLLQTRLNILSGNVSMVYFQLERIRSGESDNRNVVSDWKASNQFD